MNIFEIREVIRAPIDSNIGGRQVNLEWKAEACAERKSYEEALLKALNDSKLSQEEKEWVDVDLEIVRRPHDAVLAALGGKTEGDKISAGIPLFLSSTTQDSVESLAIETQGVRGSELVQQLFAGLSGDFTLVKEGDACYYEFTLQGRALDSVLQEYQKNEGAT